MPRPALTPEQRRQTQRRIRQAAADLYAESGMADISARAIAKRAGVSVGTLYSYFENLTELMQSLWKGPRSRLLADMEVVAEAHADPEARLRALLDRYATFAISERAVYRGAYLFVRPETLEKPRKAAAAKDRFHQLVTAAIEAGQQAGQFRAGDAGLLAQGLWAGLHGAIALPINIDRLSFAPPKRLIAQTLELLLAGLKAD